MTSGRITVTRRSPADIGQRQILLQLDGADFAILKHGGEATREVEPGRHRLKVHNTLFWKHVELDLAPGEQARFSVVNRAGWGTWTMQGILGVGPIYLDVVREDEPRSGAAAAAPAESGRAAGPTE